MRALAFVLLLLAMAVPASARLWKPTPQQQIADYLSITHNKLSGDNVVVSWWASPLVTAPTMKPVPASTFSDVEACPRPEPPV